MLKKLFVIGFATMAFQLFADAPKVCFISIGSHDEKEEFVEHLMRTNGSDASTISGIKTALGSNWASRLCNQFPGDGTAQAYASISRQINCREMVTNPGSHTSRDGSSGWLDRACQESTGPSNGCDSLVISGHFDAGLFYQSSTSPNDEMSLHDLQRRSCDRSCAGVINQPAQILSFACSTGYNPPPGNRSCSPAVSSMGLMDQTNCRIASRTGNMRSYGEQMRGIFDGEIGAYPGTAPLGARARSSIRTWLRQTETSSQSASGLRGFQSMVSDTMIARDTRPFLDFVNQSNRGAAAQTRFRTPSTASLSGMTLCQGYEQERLDPEQKVYGGQHPIRQLLCSFYFPTASNPSLSELKLRTTQALNTLMNLPSYLEGQGEQDQLQCPSTYNTTDCWRYYSEAISVYFAQLPVAAVGLQDGEYDELRGHVAAEVARVNQQCRGVICPSSDLQSQIASMRQGNAAPTLIAESLILKSRLNMISDNAYQAQLLALFPNLRSGRVTRNEADVVCSLHNRFMFDMNEEQVVTALGRDFSGENEQVARLRRCLRN